MKASGFPARARAGNVVRIWLRANEVHALAN